MKKLLHLSFSLEPAETLENAAAVEGEFQKQAAIAGNITFGVK